MTHEINFGVDPDTLDGYLVYLPDQKLVITSRDVVFDEGWQLRFLLRTNPFAAAADSSGVDPPAVTWVKTPHLRSCLRKSESSAVKTVTFEFTEPCISPVTQPVISPPSAAVLPTSIFTNKYDTTSPIFKLVTAQTDTFPLDAILSHTPLNASRGSANILYEVHWTDNMRITQEAISARESAKPTPWAVNLRTPNNDGTFSIVWKNTYEPAGVLKKAHLDEYWRRIKPPTSAQVPVVNKTTSKNVVVKPVTTASVRRSPRLTSVFDRVPATDDTQSGSDAVDAAQSFVSTSSSDIFDDSSILTAHSVAVAAEVDAFKDAAMAPDGS